jgi:hypothetical protein
LLAQFHYDGGFRKGIYKIQEHKTQNPTGVHGLTGYGDVNKSSHPAYQHFNQHTPFQHAQKSMYVFIPQSPDMLVKRKSGEQNQQQIAHYQYIRINTPFGQQGPEHDKKGIGNQEYDRNRSKSLNCCFIFHV